MKIIGFDVRAGREISGVVLLLLSDGHRLRRCNLHSVLALGHRLPNVVLYAKIIEILTFQLPLGRLSSDAVPSHHSTHPRRPLFHTHAASVSLQYSQRADRRSADSASPSILYASSWGTVGAYELIHLPKSRGD